MYDDAVLQPSLDVPFSNEPNIFGINVRIHHLSAFRAMQTVAIFLPSSSTLFRLQLSPALLPPRIGVNSFRGLEPLLGTEVHSDSPTVPFRSVQVRSPYIGCDYEKHRDYYLAHICRATM